MTAMPKVLIADELSPAAVQVFRNRGLEVDEKIGLKPKELRDIIGDYDGLAVRSATKVTPEVIAVAKKLKVVGRAGIGIDNIDLKAATAAGICVMNTPFGNSITTAEHAIAMMMALARHIPQADRTTQAGKWEKSKFVGVELYAKTLGLIGCGNIGSIVADRAQGLKMKVIAYDPFLSPDRALDLGVEKVELDELYGRADFISLHTPLTDQTRGMINKDSLAKCRPGIRIVNCARGGLIVEDDLRAELESGHVGGAALDVFSEEPATSNVVFNHPHVVTTPHLGASSTEAQLNVALQVAEQMSDFLLHGAVTNALNMPSVTVEEAPRLRPYLKLAEQLGSFAGQVTEDPIKRIVVEYEGHAASLNIKPLTGTILQAVLRGSLDNVNMVNAAHIAKERDIQVSEVRTEREGDYHTLIRLTVETDRFTRDIAGTLFAEKRPRLVQIKGISVDAELGPHMLYITNEDKPGMIGNLGTTLGDNKINIATFALGRSAPGQDAIALIEIDGPIPAAVLEKVRKLPNVRQAKALVF
jgi:D-3-phosphoglycerate dehydrogenase / 2-oxoglutarate reductase